MIWCSVEIKKTQEEPKVFKPKMLSFPYSLPTIHGTKTCCFYCATRSVKGRVAEMLEALPSDVWETAVKPEMILPLMRRISLADPLRRMPLAWLEELPLQCPRHCSQATARYWEMCRMVGKGPGELRFQINVMSKTYSR